jgi:hypothetical protein
MIFFADEEKYRALCLRYEIRSILNWKMKQNPDLAIPFNRQKCRTPISAADLGYSTSCHSYSNCKLFVMRFK